MTINIYLTISQDNEIDPEVTDLINNANMEMLATLVLNGEGSRLIGRISRNSELQAFLDNVPTYMVTPIFTIIIMHFKLTIVFNSYYVLAKNKQSAHSSKGRQYTRSSSGARQTKIRDSSRLDITEWGNSFTCGDHIRENKHHQVFGWKVC